MRKRIEPTIVEQAIENVAGFNQEFKKLEQQIILKGQRSSTLHNYIRRIASISLHFGKLPEQIDDDEINEYLTSLALNPKSPSLSNFKHAMYGLRYYYQPTPARLRLLAVSGSLFFVFDFLVFLNQGRQ